MITLDNLEKYIYENIVDGYIIHEKVIKDNKTNQYYQFSLDDNISSLKSFVDIISSKKKLVQAILTDLIYDLSFKINRIHHFSSIELYNEIKSVLDNKKFNSYEEFQLFFEYFIHQIDILLDEIFSKILHNYLHRVKLSNTHYLYIHESSYINKKTKKSFGKGLFTNRFLKTNVIVGEFKGKFIDKNEFDNLSKDSIEIQYIIQFSENLFLSCYPMLSYCKLSYANSAKNSKHKITHENGINNCRLKLDQKNKIAYLVTIKDISEYTELLWDYGDSFVLD